MSERPPEVECGTCQYAEPTIGTDEQPFLECRRYPPTVMWVDRDGEPLRTWPSVSGDDWCGEWTA